MIEAEHGGAEMAWEIQRVQIAEAFGWSMEYVDGLSYEQVQAIFGYWDGKNKAEGNS